LLRPLDDATFERAAADAPLRYATLMPPITLQMPPPMSDAADAAPARECLMSADAAEPFSASARHWFHCRALAAEHFRRAISRIARQMPRLSAPAAISLLI